MNGPVGDVGTWPRVDGPIVVITPRVAAIIGPELGAGLDRRLRQDGAVDREYAATVRAIDHVGRAYRARSAAGTPGIPKTADLGTVSAMSTAAVADRLGTTERNVTALAARGSIVGDKVDGRWQFDPIHVEEYLTQKQEGAA